MINYICGYSQPMYNTITPADTLIVQVLTYHSMYNRYFVLIEYIHCFEMYK